MSKPDNRLNICWRHQPPDDSPYAPLIHYLNSSATFYPKKECFLTAMQAFWYPFAVEYQGSPPQEVTKAAEQAIASLENQIALLKLRFGVSPTERPCQTGHSHPPPTETPEPVLEDIEDADEYNDDGYDEEDLTSLDQELENLF